MSKTVNKVSKMSKVKLRRLADGNDDVARRCQDRLAHLATIEKGVK